MTMNSNSILYALNYYQVYKIDVTAETGTSVAGTNIRGNADGTGTSATFDNPKHMSMSFNGRYLWVVDDDLQHVRRITTGIAYSSEECNTCPSGSTSAGGPVTECLCEVDTYQPQQCAFGESGDCGNRYVKVMDAECADMTEIRMFEGNGDNEGTEEERVKACSEACLRRQTALTNSWVNFDLQGFIVYPSTGRCFCEQDNAATCTQVANGFHRYNWIGDKHCCLIDRDVTTHGCTACPTDGTSANYKFIRHGECNDGNEIHMADVTGSTQAEKAANCASGCWSRGTPYSSVTWSGKENWVIQGFIIHPTYGGCWCETSLGATCSHDNDSWQRHDFTSPSECTGDCATNEAAVVNLLPYTKMFDGECSGGYEIRVSDHTTVQACADACIGRSTSISSGSWSGFDLQGFLTHDTLDYCFCEDNTLPCTESSNAYNRYNWIQSQQDACPACPPGTTSDGSGPVCTCQANYYGHLRYDFTDKNSLADWQAYATEIGGSTSVTSYDENYQGTGRGGGWISGTGQGSLHVPLPAEYDTMSIKYGHGYESDVVRLCLCSTMGKLCDDPECTVVQTPIPYEILTYTTTYTPGQVIVIQEELSIFDANVVIDLYRTGRTLIYDFTDKNSLADWQAYATGIGGTSYITDYAPDGIGADGIWATSEAIGWLNVPLPLGYDTVTIQYGHGYNSGEVRLCLCSVSGKMCSDAECMIVATHTSEGDHTYTTSYTSGQALQLEEGFAILNADVVITLTSTPGCTACPSGSESAGGAVTECTCSVNTAKQVKTAVFDQYTLPCMNWFFEHNGNYYMYLNSASNWAQKKANNDAAKVTTYWSALRLSQRPVQGDTSVTIIRDDFTFATGGTQRWMSAYSCCTYCHTGGSNCAYFSVDLTGTPFTMIGSSQPTCCFGWDAGPGPSQTVIGTYTATGHVGGGGGGTCIDTAGPDTTVSRDSCTWPDYTNGGTELRLMSDEDHLTICPEFEDTECVACPAGSSSTGGLTTECTLDSCAANEYMALGTLVSEEDRLFTRNCVSDSNCGTDDGYGNTIQADGATFVNLGEITYNTNTNGGFTLITKMQFTGPYQAYSSYERIFGSASAMSSSTYNIELLRHGTNDQLYFS